MVNIGTGTPDDDDSRDEIRRIVREIEGLATRQLTLQAYFQEFVSRMVAALAAHGGSVWLRKSRNAELDCVCDVHARQISVDDKGSYDSFREHARCMMQQDAALLEPVTLADRRNYLYIWSPIRVRNEVVGVFHVVQRAGTGPASQRGYLRFTEEMTSILSRFLERVWDDFAQEFPDDSSTKWIKIYFTRDPHDARIVWDILRDEGIRSRVSEPHG